MKVLKPATIHTESKTSSNIQNFMRYHKTRYHTMQYQTRQDETISHHTTQFNYTLRNRDRPYRIIRNHELSKNIKCSTQFNIKSMIPCDSTQNHTTPSTTLHHTKTIPHDISQNPTKRFTSLRPQIIAKDASCVSLRYCAGSLMFCDTVRCTILCNDVQCGTIPYKTKQNIESQARIPQCEPKRNRTIPYDTAQKHTIA